MGIISYLKWLKGAREYRRKEFVSPDEFIHAFEGDFGRPMDSMSALWFRSRPASTNLLNKMCMGKLRQSGSDHDSQILTLILVEMLGYMNLTPDEHMRVSERADDSLEIQLRAFSRQCPDAGNIIAQGLAVYYK